MSSPVARSARSVVESLESRRMFAVVAAEPSDDFVESIGVNWRSGQNNANSTQYNTIRTKLGDLGIRYIRDSISSTNTTQQNRVLELNNLYGIKFEAFFDTQTNGVLDVSKIDALVNFYDNYPDLFWGIDGPNEYDASTDPNKYANLLNYQQQLFNKIQANAVLRDLPVVGPPFGQIGRFIDALNQQGIGAYRPATDASNIHAYSSGDQHPTQPNFDWDNTARKFHAETLIGNYTSTEATGSGSPTAGNARTRTFSNWSLSAGDDVHITISRQNGDTAPIDYLQFNPVGGGASIRVEAENMTLSGNATLGNLAAASGGKFVSSSNGGSSLNAVFNGPSGNYNIVVGYFDENDGNGGYNLIKNANRPIYWTETGYHNAVNGGGVSEAISAFYIPQIFLGGYMRGYEKTFLYNIIDNADDPGKTDREKNFGLLRFDGTEKPAFRSLENLIDLMQDSGPAFTAGSLNYDLTGSTNNVKTDLFQKRNGTFMMPIYVEGVAHNRSTQTLTPLTRAVTLTFNQPVSVVRVYEPTDSTTPVQTFTNPTSINLTASSKTKIIEIVPVVATVLNNSAFDGSINNQTSFEAAFNVNTVSNNRMTFNATSGVGGSGGINVPAGQLTSAINNNGFAGFGTYGTITQEIDTKIIGTGTASPAGQAFWGSLKSSNATGVGGLAFGIKYTGAASPKFNVVVSNNGAETVIGTVNFGASSWYRFVSEWTLDPSDGNFDLSVSLYTLGATGTSTPSLQNTWNATNLSNATIASANTLFSGVHGKTRDSAGVQTIDNLKVTGTA